MKLKNNLFAVFLKNDYNKSNEKGDWDMDLKICGILDIILIVAGIVFLIIGYKKGFIKKLISLAGILVIIIFSIVYCSQFAQFLIHHKVFYPNFYNNIFNNIITNLEKKNIAGDATVTDVLVQGLNIPKFIASMLANGIVKEGQSLPTVLEIADAIAKYLGTALMNIISFFILAVGIFLLVLILKILASVLRTNKLVKVVDGILGALFYLTIFATVVCVLFYFLSLCMNQEWFKGARDWLTVDMQLETNHFRLSKLVYQGNIIKKIFDLIF